MVEMYPLSNVKVVEVTFEQHADEALELVADKSTNVRYLLDI